MSVRNLQIIGLVLNIIGTLFFGIGTLDRSSLTWDDIAKQSSKAIKTHRLAWLGLVIIFAGFIMQLFTAI